MKKITAAFITVALIALFSTPLIADSESWVSNQQQIITQTGDTN